MKDSFCCILGTKTKKERMNMPETRNQLMDVTESADEIMNAPEIEGIEIDGMQPAAPQGLPLPAFVAGMIYHRLRVDEMEWK